jgi:hypothetical protein
MRSLAPYLVTFPLIVSPMAEAWLKPAFAQAVTAEQALTLLARSTAADAKCHHLSDAEHQELSDYLAKAEIAQAGRSSPEETQSIIATGRAQGRESLCGPDSQDEVQETLVAAREAMRHEPGAEEPEQRTAAAPVGKAPEAKKTNVRTADKPKSDLAGYGQEAMAYYVERRCGHLSNAEAREFWNHVVARHNAVLRAYGKRAVAAALQAAEAAAGRRSCGMRSAALVEATFRNLQGL